MPIMFEAMSGSHVTIELKDGTIVTGRVLDYEAEHMNFTLEDVSFKARAPVKNTRAEKRAKSKAKRLQTQEQQGRGQWQHSGSNDGSDQWIKLPSMLVSGRQIRYVHMGPHDNVAQMLGDHLDRVGKRRNKIGNDRAQQKRNERKRKRSRISEERRAKFARMKQEATERRDQLGSG